MKVALLMEGGAMRGMYTAGVIDIMMENNITFDAAVGVSAGAVFGSNIKSKQIGRVIRYNTRFCQDPRYMSIKNLIQTGDLFAEQFCYHDIPYQYDVFEQKTYQENPMDFYVVCTDVKTGKPVYHLCNTGDETDIKWMRASASMPIVSRPVEIDTYTLLDGGISDAVPIRWLKKQGYDKIVVILTRDKRYKKKKNNLIPLLKVVMKKYPAIVKAMAKRHQMYNDSIKMVNRLEEKGDIFVFRPSQPIEIGRIERRPEKLREVYQLGKTDALNKLASLKDYLKNE